MASSAHSSSAADSERATVIAIGRSTSCSTSVVWRRGDVEGESRPGRQGRRIRSPSLVDPGGVQVAIVADRIVVGGVVRRVEREQVDRSLAAGLGGRIEASRACPDGRRVRSPATEQQAVHGDEIPGGRQPPSGDQRLAGGGARPDRPARAQQLVDARERCGSVDVEDDGLGTRDGDAGTDPCRQRESDQVAALHAELSELLDEVHVGHPSTRVVVGSVADRAATDHPPGVGPVRTDGRDLGCAVPVHQGRGGAPVATGGGVRSHVHRCRRPRADRPAHRRDPRCAAALAADPRLRRAGDGWPLAAADQRRAAPPVRADRVADRLCADRRCGRRLPARRPQRAASEAVAGHRDRAQRRGPARRRRPRRHGGAVVERGRGAPGLRRLRDRAVHRQPPAGRCPIPRRRRHLALRRRHPLHPVRVDRPSGRDRRPARPGPQWSRSR